MCIQEELGRKNVCTRAIAQSIEMHVKCVMSYLAGSSFPDLVAVSSGFATLRILSALLCSYRFVAEVVLTAVAVVNRTAGFR